MSLGTEPCTNHMQEAGPLFENRALPWWRGRDLNPRPLGYEPYDVRLPHLKPSLAGAVTPADRTDPISLRRLRLPCLELSRRVRFTNRFTEQAIDLRFPASFPPFRGCHPLDARHRVRARQATASWHGLDARDAWPPVVPDVGPQRPGRHHLYRAYTGASTAPLLPRPSPEPDYCRT